MRTGIAVARAVFLKNLAWLTTHDLAEVEALCSRITVVRQGAMMFGGTASGLEAQVEVQSALQVVFRSAPTGPNRSCRPVWSACR